MLKFVLFSASAGIVQIGSFTLLNELTNRVAILRLLSSLVAPFDFVELHAQS